MLCPISVTLAYLRSLNFSSMQLARAFATSRALLHLLDESRCEHGTLQQATFANPRAFGGHHWRYALPGRGAASPIVWGERVYLLNAVPADPAAGARGVHKFNVLAIDRRDGKIAWQHTAREEALRQIDSLIHVQQVFDPGQARDTIAHKAVRSAPRFSVIHAARPSTRAISSRTPAMPPATICSHRESSRRFRHRSSTRQPRATRTRSRVPFVRTHRPCRDC